ncbi:MAG TPA: GAF domain-containing SpoIIE family protein phosphatase [Gemmatimonadaceae bacterium]|nr:GAF domain-containing SpoIIE family protein phosphatase [Gemmatimonadaceae bacterium]
MKELEAVLIAFREGTHCEAAVWGSGDGRSPPTVIARSSSKVQMPDVLPDEPGQSVPTNFGTQIVTRVPSVKKIWLTVGPCDPSYSPEDRHIKLLMPVVSQFTQAALEVEHAATELAERYEEINLLYTIGEILGRTVTLEDAAATILTEISETVGARVASILVHDARTNTLQAVAALGVPKSEIPPINADDQSSVSARVFRTQHPLIVVGKGVTFGKESPYGRGEMLSVPIMWTTPSGGMPLGVVNLADRRSRQPFTAGDQKLVTAIATQIGTAIQNARLVSASLDQQRLLQEMSLAHDLQMKLLPSTDVVAPQAEATARVIPAESVGGDFYQLFKLRDATATGVMIGDVSGHGYRAALIMALSMSASAIHAQNFINPGEMLGALLQSLREELETTEMFISIFYGVVDPGKGRLSYANTGHPHAFVISEEGTITRLSAVNPPLGMLDEVPQTASLSWVPGKDLLILFTDGISDARNASDERLGEDRVLELIKENRENPTKVIVDRVFKMLEVHTRAVPSRDDLTLVVLRS